MSHFKSRESILQLFSEKNNILKAKKHIWSFFMRLVIVLIGWETVYNRNSKWTAFLNVCNINIYSYNIFLILKNTPFSAVVWFTNKTKNKTIKVLILLMFWLNRSVTMETRIANASGRMNSIIIFKIKIFSFSYIHIKWCIINANK